MARATEVANARAFSVDCALSLLSCPLYFQNPLGHAHNKSGDLSNMQLETG
jgi:hypothetical protein